MRFPGLLCWLAISAGCLLLVPAVRAEEDYRSSDPFAAIDGVPIYLGELNLVLSERFSVRQLASLDPQVRRATALLLVRRHLAMKSLQQQGGEALQAIVDRQIASLEGELKRRGSSLAEHAELRVSTEASLRDDLAWRAAWGQYLKSKLNDQNLRIFFERQKDRYAGGRWRVSQIFLEIDAGDEESLSQSRQRMSELAAELTSAESVEPAFAAAARQYSDSSSSADGGLVGWVEKDGDLPTSVMQAVRTTKVGQVSQPIQSPLGMHLILVHEHQPGEMEFDDLTDHGQLRRDATNALFDALVRNQADANVVWFIPALRPPAAVEVVPK